MHKFFAALFAFIAGLGIIGWLMAIVVSILGFICFVKGVILAFTASVVLGLLMLVFFPSYSLLGLVWYVAHVDLAQQVVNYFSQH